MTYRLVEHHGAHAIINGVGDGAVAVGQLPVGWLKPAEYANLIAPDRSHWEVSALDAYLHGIVAGLAMGAAHGVLVLPAPRIGSSNYAAVTPAVIAALAPDKGARR